MKEKPADYDAAFRERYGLHPAPYPNDGLPMGLRKAAILLGKGVGTDCLLCHGGSILGKSYVGLGNTALDIQALFEELAQAGGQCRQAAVHVLQRPRHQRGRRLRRLPARLPRARPALCATPQGPRPARRPVRGRAGVVAAEEEEDHVPHRRDRRPLACGR